MSRLAIVIPAYKSVFLEKTLSSIACQTCKDFTVYIGNDFSPYDLKTKVDPYRDLIDICYQEFKENLGGKDLVAQWERCIDMVRDEEWIWLFSDDDLMDPGCVDRFYSVLAQEPNCDLFHFNVSQIDENDNIIKDLSSFPDMMTCEEYLNRRLKGNLYSFVVEYIFRRSHFMEMGRFENFDLAWGSDDATWIKLSNRYGILNIDGARVYWRESLFNISPDFSSPEILNRKFASQVEFAKWIYNSSESGKLRIESKSLKNKLTFQYFKTIKDRIEFISFRTLNRILSLFYREIYQKNPPLLKTMFFYSFKGNRILKRAVKKLVFWDFFKMWIIDPKQAQ
jgi:hypothetical protein